MTTTLPPQDSSGDASRWLKEAEKLEQAYHNVVTKYQPEAAMRCIRAAFAALTASPPSSDGLTIPDELRELSEKATAGEWVASLLDDRADDGRLSIHVAAGTVPVICFEALPGGSHLPQRRANAALVAAAVNFVRQALSDQEPSHVR